MKPGYAYITSIWSAALWGGAYPLVDASTGEIIAVLSAGGVHYAIGWQPDKKTFPNMNMRQRKALSFDIIRFKKKYELKEGHVKRFAKLAMESE